MPCEPMELRPSPRKAQAPVDELMGEIADHLIDDMRFSSWSEKVFRHHLPIVKGCQRCGRSDLRWGNVKGGAWRLHEKDGTLHSCDWIQGV